jgi:signal peptidase I
VAGLPPDAQDVKMMLLARTMMDQTGMAPTSSPPPAAKRSLVGALVHWLRDLFFSVVLAVIVILFLYQPVKVEGTSMMPTLDDQERIFINKFVYRFHFENINRGDTVVFWFPGDPTKSYIKRVIGIPGDRLEVDNGTVVVNGHPLVEDYVPAEFRDRNSMPAETVPPDEFFVLGDHRSSSNDSRSWGMVPRRYIYGKAVFIYWPFDKMGVLK